MRNLLVFLVLAVEAAASPVLSFNPAGASSGNENDQTIGWMFDVVSPLTVSGLGWYAPNGAGLAFAHTVGIWDAGGSLLTSATVAAGAVDPLDGLFRTISISPVLLAPGTGYIVGGQNFLDNTDQLAFGAVPSTIASIVFTSGVYSDIDGVFELPTFLTGDGGDPNCCWGPSFSFSDSATAAAPEPGTLVLFAAAFLFGLGLWAIRQMRTGARRFRLACR